MRTFLLSSGIEMPAFGLGTWHMGERASQRRAEADALRYALDLGIRLIDTAEMYGEGGAEEIIGEALQGRRADAIIVSKVYPHNASRQGVIDACRERFDVTVDEVETAKETVTFKLPRVLSA